MSLDVYLEQPCGRVRTDGPKIFIREDGQTKSITREEWDEREESDTVYSANITHNLSRMADDAGIYKHLWRPEEIGIETAKQLIPPLAAGLNELIADPEKYRQFNPENGWGNYNVLVQFVREYLEACQKWPDATVRVWR